MYRISAGIIGFVLTVVMNVSANAREVCVSGECIGVKVYTDGLIITDTTTLDDTDGKKVDIASGYGIQKGDIIKKINGRDAISAADVANALKSADNITLTIERDGKTTDITVTPANTADGAKLGLWLRDSTAGMGTLTCTFDNKFVALGHGICDIDTGNIMPVKNGIIQGCSDFDITKGTPGNPGAIRGTIIGDKLGCVRENTSFGLWGTLTSDADGRTLPVASNSEVKTGKATILADVDGNGVKEYAIEIKRVTVPSDSGKDMVVEITDDELIAKTGGIIQGMSGSPIIQDGKFIGAVTHVFVKNPRRGYAILAEHMLSAVE